MEYPVQSNKPTRYSKGFTLIELLVVIAIIATLAVVVFVAFDPATRFAEARNANRWTSVNGIMTAIHVSLVDNEGVLPAGVDATPRSIGTCEAGDATGMPTGSICGATAAADCLGEDFNTEMVRYLPTMPMDPQATTTAFSGYLVSVDADNAITVSACNAEVGAVISATR